MRYWLHIYTLIVMATPFDPNVNADYSWWQEIDKDEYERRLNDNTSDL
jgi:hypothetical protein